MQPAEVREWLDGVVPDDIELVAVSEELLGHFSNEVHRVQLRWSEKDARVPASLIVKRRILNRAVPESESFPYEARVLRELATPAPVATPRVFAASDAWLVMEELVDLEPFDFVAGAPAAHVDAGLSALGRFHAHGQRAEAPAWLPSFSDPVELRRVEAGFERVWSEHRSAVEAVVPDGFSALADAFCGRSIDRLAMLGEGIVLHGDAHAENLPMQRGDIAFLDWAGARVGPPAFDVAVFLGMSLQADRRRVLEREGVERHAEAWEAAGGEPFADPWRSYARGLLLRAIHLVSQVREATLLENPGFALVTGRCALAALDHIGDTALD